MPAAAKNNPAADTAKMNLFVFIDTPTVLATATPRSNVRLPGSRCSNQRLEQQLI
jgi:hypothetical protein